MTVSSRSISSVDHTTIGRDGTGLRFSRDLEAWRSWQASQRSLLKRLRHRAVPHVGPDPMVLTFGSPHARILVAIDGPTPSITSAVIDPISHLDPASVAVLDRRARTDLVGSHAASVDVVSASEVTRLLPELTTGITIGSHLPIGEIAHDALGELGGRTLVVQHGLLTPHAPPLPKDSTLLAWTEADADYWRSGRKDVSCEVVGSQLLWHAAMRQHPSDHEGPTTFLGQLHAVELPRWSLARASISFCREHQAVYRPHPAERDKVSRAIHLAMRTSGIAFDPSTVPLRDLRAPVVATFSSGLLEAAASGQPAWAYLPSPPRWVEAFWDRYRIHRWGMDPTPAPERQSIEPAERIATLAAGREEPA